MVDQEIARQLTAHFAAEAGRRAARSTPDDAVTAATSPAVAAGSAGVAAVLPLPDAASPDSRDALVLELRDLLAEFQVARAEHAQAECAEDAEHARMAAALQEARQTAEAAQRAAIGRLDDAWEKDLRGLRATVTTARKQRDAATNTLARPSSQWIVKEAKQRFSPGSAITSGYVSPTPLADLNRLASEVKKEAEYIDSHSYRDWSAGIVILLTVPVVILVFLLGSNGRLGLAIMAIAAIGLLVLLFQLPRIRNKDLAAAYSVILELLEKIEPLQKQQEAVYSHEREEQKRAVSAQTAQQRQTLESKQEAEEARHALAMATEEERFRAVLAGLKTRMVAYGERADIALPPWSDVGWKPWRPSREIPTATRLGMMTTGLELNDLALPATVPFPQLFPLFFDVGGAMKEVAAEGVQALLLRLLATLPPAKLQMTLFDPVGLGRNVAALMPLSDKNPRLLNSRAWTEAQQFDKYLIELTDRIAEVHQKYLRTEYRSIQEYNVSARVPQPYHLLVVANYPAKFSEQTANRLASVVEAGPACGIYTVIQFDRDVTPAHGVTMDEIRRISTIVSEDGDGFRLQCAVLREHTLRLDTLPESDVSTPMLRKLGELAESAARVEVPFGEVAPPQHTWWSPQHSTAAGISVEIGLAGATNNQSLTLGKETAQHVLIAGRTGSGKSTLLHVLITALAVTYSPEELQLYLIDFKKGVEFKPYAASKLPHARVIAIESEREFGLSVLRGLDIEMTRRGELFRAVEDQNIAGYRQETGKVLPRLMLIVDEFQEFFTEDDAVSREAAMLFDRLVRQGRSFGIHIVLASQTLAGAFSLARSTMDQMGIRIAMQCSETDSRLILSDDNPMARLLSRAGEGIYNNQNGRPEGNSMFQTVWLSDEQRDWHLAQVQALATQQGITSTPIVFEGNAPAAISANSLLKEMLEQPAWPAPAVRTQAWVGDPIAIKDPTAITLRRQSGSNLLLVGQNEEAAVGMLSAMALSLAAQLAPDAQQTTFNLLDFSPVDAPFAGTLQATLAALPHGSRRGLRRDVPEMIDTIAQEVQRRLAADDGTAPPIYLIIHGLMRARDLRPDDAASFRPTFSFNLDAPAAPPPPNPAEQLHTILREGPELGVHTLIWCDTSTNLNRVLDARALREFDLRVVFQMSYEDSNHLIGSPAASKLGPHRAISYSEEFSVQEKFRPYGAPDSDWLLEAGAHLHARTMPAPELTACIAD